MYGLFSVIFIKKGNKSEMNKDGKKTILIVDDAKPFREGIMKLLTNDFCDTIGAKDGKEGVAMYKEHDPELVLLDINMPKLNGVDALQQIIKHNPQARVIMISNEDDNDVIDDCIGFGALKYIIKPFSEDVLLQAVHVALFDEA
jgi:two-component system response regulator DegU